MVTLCRRAELGLQQQDVTGTEDSCTNQPLEGQSACSTGAVTTQIVQDSETFVQHLRHGHEGDLSQVQSPLHRPKAKNTLRSADSFFNYCLVSLRVQSVTRLLPLISNEHSMVLNVDNESSCKTTYSFYTAAWMVRMGLGSGLHLGIKSSSLQGWKASLQPFNVIPFDSPVIELCQQGNLPVVRSLLSNGLASIRDRDIHGGTLL